MSKEEDVHSKSGKTIVNRRTLLRMAGIAAGGIARPALESAPAQKLESPLDRPCRECDVVIVGAGLSGLRAAQLLSGAGLDVLVLDAQNRVGGRTLTVQPKGSLLGAFIDHGGQWVSPGQTSLMALARELDVQLFETWHKGATVDWHKGNRSVYSEQYPDYWTQVDKDDAEGAVEKLTDMANTFDLESPWLAKDASRWDGQTLEGWLAANVRSSLARLAALFVLRSAQDLIRHFHPSGIDQRFVGGAQQLSIKMAEPLGHRVILGTWVSQFNHSCDGVLAISDRLSVTAKRAIITLPPALAGRLRYVPSLPAARDHLTESTPMGWVIKVHCVYPDRFWKTQGLSGAVTSDEGAVRATADNSPPSGSPAILVGFIEGKAARDLAPKPVE
jgi:monoamine oxidase